MKMKKNPSLFSLLSLLSCFSLFTSLSFSVLPTKVHAADEVINCASLWKGGFPDGRFNKKFSCSFHEEKEIDGSPVKVYHYSDGWAGRPEELQILSWMDEVLNKSASVLNTTKLGLFPDLAIILTNFSDADTDVSMGNAVFASARFNLLEEGEPCAILIYKEIFARNEGEIKQILAHEIYHCAQKFNLGFDKGELYKSQSWWVEGTADYFSGRVYPKTNFEFISAREYKPQFMLFLQPNEYSTSAFFQSLSNSWVGPDAVDSLVEDLALVREYPEQWKIFAGYPSMDLHFKRFAEELTTGRIVDAGGGFLPKISLVPSFTFDVKKDSQTYEIQFRPFSIISSTFTFPKGGRFEVIYSANDLDEDDFSVMTREGGKDGLWEDIYADYPKVIDTSCNAKSIQQEFLPISVVPKDKMKTAKMKVTYKDARCLCEDKVEFDSCLRGKWELSNDSILEMFKKIFSASQMEVVGVQGKAMVQMTSDKHFTINYDNYRVTLKKEDFFEGKPMILETSLEGISRANLGRPEKTDLCFRDIETEAKVTSTITMDGNTATGENMILDFLEKGVHRYQCTSDQLTFFRKLTIDGEEVEVPMIFYRRSSE